MLGEGSDPRGVSDLSWSDLCLQKSISELQVTTQPLRRLGGFLGLESRRHPGTFSNSYFGDDAAMRRCAREHTANGESASVSVQLSVGRLTKKLHNLIRSAVAGWLGCNKIFPKLLK